MTRMLIVLSSIVSLGLYQTTVLPGYDNPFKAALSGISAGLENQSKPLACYTVASADDPSQVSPATKKQAAKPVAKAAGTTAKGTAAAITINMNVVPEMMQFTKTAFTVKAGQKVIIDFENGDNMQHNMVIIKPGTSEKVGTAADELARDPKGALKHYVPQMPEVLHASKLLDPEASFTLEFTAPAQPGDYPYLCTFPGHWRMMKGIMKVVK
ncbi:MAG: plastocyanin/azurin family copper-binding protein [Chitinophagaceae bacterium]